MEINPFSFCNFAAEICDDGLYLSKKRAFCVRFAPLLQPKCIYYNVIRFRNG